MKIGVIGSGVMGSGIAQVCAQSAYQVVLYDISPESLRKAEQAIRKNLDKAVELGKLTDSERLVASQNLKLTDDIAEVRADLLIEAAVEKKEIKVDLFSKLMDLNGPESIYTTNTSSIPVTQIAAATTYPERVVGLHFFNPVHIMKLVEVVRGAHTAEHLVEKCTAFAESLGKIAVCAADSPGFIVNRVARNYYVEALKILEEQVTSVEEIDLLMEATGFRMGPFRLMDLIGVDTNYAVTESMYEQFYQDPKFRPSRAQKQKVDAGFHGRKSGRGFYVYD